MTDNNNIKIKPIDKLEDNCQWDRNYFQTKQQQQNNELSPMIIKSIVENKQDDGETTHLITVGIESHQEDIDNKMNEENKIKTMTTQIKLTESEILLFKELMNAVLESGCGSTLRVAGGWVRDKLRGEHSHDIDITLDNMMGEAFAGLVNKHLSSKNHKTHRIGVIQSNPDQSKHLEAATVKIFDMWIDFVNLRSETYTDTSRIPQISIGTPKQDSLRRDLTINSLFFNINENRIEDFTGRGIDDLIKGIIRTPLPSLTTFLDDPLRVFRSIRFASRFSFTIDQDLSDAASNPIVKQAILTKISHERIAKEFDGMISHGKTDKAIELINQYDLYDCLFSLPTEGFETRENLDPDYRKSSEKYCSTMISFGLDWGQEFQNDTVGNVSDTKRQRILSSLMIPFYGFTYKNVYKKNKILSIIHYMFVDYIKFSNKDYDDVTVILDSVDKLSNHLSSFLSFGNFNRKEIGLILFSCGPLWVAALSTMMIKLISVSYPPDEQTHTDLITAVTSFAQAIKSHNLIGVWNLKRLLDGKQVQDILQKKSGPWLAPVMQSILEWQLEFPTKTEQDCREFILKFK